jgi:hypothetical protein
VPAHHPVFGDDALGINLDRERKAAIERAGDALTPVNARAIVVFDRLLSGDTNCVLASLDLQVILVDARQLDDGNEIVAFLKNVYWRIAASACSANAKPITCQVRLQRPLDYRKHREVSLRDQAGLAASRT